MSEIIDGDTFSVNIEKTDVGLCLKYLGCGPARIILKAQFKDRTEYAFPRLDYARDIVLPYPSETFKSGYIKALVCPLRSLIKSETSIVDSLNEALATELVCVLRYKRHYFMAHGSPSSESVREEFLSHAHEEQGHADQIAKRIVEIGGQPNMNPEGLLDCSKSKYVEGTDLTSMIRENLAVEAIAIQTYTNMIHSIGESDPATKKMIEDILQVECEHHQDMLRLLGEGFIDKAKKKQKKGFPTEQEID